MATDIQTARTTLESQRQALEQRRQQIERTQIRSLTQAELRRQTRTSMVQRKQQEQQFAQRRKEAIQQLEPVETQLRMYEEQIKIAEGLQREYQESQHQIETYEKAKTYIREGREVYAKDDPELRRAIEDLKDRGVRGYQDVQARAEDIKTKLQLGQQFPELQDIEPVIVDGKIVGVSGMTATGTGLQIPIEPFDYKQKQPPSYIHETEEKGFLGKTSQIIESELLKLKHQGKVEEKVDLMTQGIIASISIPESAKRETPIQSINLPTPIGETQISRPVSFEDVDTGVLPPQQNFEMKIDKILTDFNIGTISEPVALERLEQAETQLLKDMLKRETAVQVAEGVVVGGVSALAPPVGGMIAGAYTYQGLKHRTELLEMIKRAPIETGTSFLSFGAGSMLGGGVFSASKFKIPKVEEIKIKLISGKARQKIIEENLKIVEPEFEALIRNERITGTRTFEIEIPTPEKPIILRILEYEKDGIKSFIGIEEGLTRPGVSFGQTIFKGESGLTELITRSVRFSTKGRLTNAQVSEIVEVATLKASKSTGFKRLTLTESEARLSKQFDLKGLKPHEIREVIRNSLFSEKEALARKGKPFTKEEFESALLLSKDRVKMYERAYKVKITKLIEKEGLITKEKTIFDTRILEKGFGSSEVKHIKPVKTTKKIKTPEGFIITPVKKVKKVATRKKTPLSQTFAVQTPKTKLKIKQRTPSPIGAFKQIASTIQKEATKKFVKTKAKAKVKEVAGVSLVSGVGATTPRSEYWGKGMYERTEGGFVPGALKGKVSLVETQAQRNLQAKTLAPILASLTSLTYLEKVAVVNKIVSLQRTGQQQKLDQLLRSLYKQAQEQKLVTPQKQPQKITTPKPRPKPIIKPPPILMKIPQEKIIRRVLEKKKAYDVYVKQQGKYNKIADDLPFYRAKKKGSSFVDRDLSATFKLVPDGFTRKKDIKPFKLPKETFRDYRKSKGKRIPLKNTWIERRSARIDTPEEIFQIQKSRQKKGTKKQTKSKWL